jgi:putative FmdB family regulatory protein
MPIYEYRCGACGHELEVLQKISDQPLTDCPSCGKAALAKLVSAAGFQLKGSGWYVTDFRDSKKAKDSGKSGDSGKDVEAAAAKDPETSGSKESSPKDGKKEATGPSKSDSKA